MAGDAVQRVHQWLSAGPGVEQLLVGVFAAVLRRRSRSGPWWSWWRRVLVVAGLPRSGASSNHAGSTYVPLARASNGGCRRLGVGGDEHRTLLRAGLDRRRAGIRDGSLRDLASSRSAPIVHTSPLTYRADFVLQWKGTQLRIQL